MIQSLIAIELAYINTNHPDFCRAGAALAAFEHTIDTTQNATNINSTEDHLSNIYTSEIIPSIIDSTMVGVQSSPSTTQLQNSNGGILNFFFRSSNSNNQQIRGGMAAVGAVSPSPSSSPSIYSTTSTSLPPTLLAMAPEPTSVNSSKSKILSTVESKAFTEKEEMETHLILTLIRSYFNVVRKNIVDSVPKAIMHFLVNAVKENLHNRLVTELYRSDSEKIFDVLLQEDPTIVKERERISTIISTLSQAIDILAEIDNMASE